MAMELQDGAIIQKYLAGDKEAFSLLVNRYKKPVYVFVYRMVYQREEADDLAQEVFIKAYENLWRCNPDYQFSSWLFQNTKNLCADALRPKKTVLAGEAEMESRADNPVSPEREYFAPRFLYIEHMFAYNRNSRALGFAAAACGGPASAAGGSFRRHNSSGG